MRRSGDTLEQQSKAAVDLRRRAARVRRLMGGMTSKAEYDRLRGYAKEMDARATELEQRSEPEGNVP